MLALRTAPSMNAPKLPPPSHMHTLATNCCKLPTWMAHRVLAVSTFPGIMGGGTAPLSAPSRLPAGQALMPSVAAAAAGAAAPLAARSTAAANSSASTWCPPSEGCDLHTRDEVQQEQV